MITTATHNPRAWAVPDLSNADYHGDLEHDSSTSLRKFEESPGKYYHERITGRIKRKQETDAMRLGSAAHAAILEPEKLHQLISVIPPEVLTKDGKKAGSKFDLWSWKHRDKILLKQDEYDLLRWKVDAVREDKDARELLETCTVFEHSIFWVTEDGYKLKCRLDMANEQMHVIGDLKSIADLSRIAYSVEDRSYLSQAALYCWGYEHLYGTWPEFKYLWVESDPPFECVITPLNREQLTAGMTANYRTLHALHQCRAGIRPWRKYSGVMPLQLPCRVIDNLHRGDN